MRYMSITNVMLEAFMQLTSNRQATLADNIARINSPGQLSKDVEMPNNFGDLVKSASSNSEIGITVTNSKHLSGSKPKINFRTKIDRSGKMKPNGNNIDLTNEATKASSNQIMYDTALKAYKSSSGLVKTALGKNGR